jgi:alkanesulfonate monooxygenase SsuD/methylene tetrahydromethanopterin reductase-like flavin-dependent oxidoreductase (luciferase family)
VPRPTSPYEIWQAITSPGSLEAVPARGFGGVFWLLNDQLLKQRWERYAEVYEAAHGTGLARGAKRNVVVNVCVGDTYEQAVEAARPGHDEFWRFLGQYGWARGYRGPGGGPAPKGWMPELEDSISQKVWVVGTAEQVAETLAGMRDDIGIQDLTIFPSMPGESYDRAADQLHRFAEQVRPLLDPATGSPALVPSQVSAAG